MIFFFNDTATTEIYTLSLHDALPISAIVVFGEEPYAEFVGDRATLEFSPADKKDLNLMRKLKAAGVPVVAVFLSGRPMWVKDRKSTRLNSSHANISYAVFCLKKKKNN